MKVETLFSCQYLTGCLEEIDTRSIANMVLKNYHKGRLMSKDIASIRNEDVRIDFNSDIQLLAKLLCEQWKLAFDQDIELCWHSEMVNVDPNQAAWAVVHAPGDQTNTHSHESSENYENGAHVSAAFWVQYPEHSGDFVFQYKTNPYLNHQHSITPQQGWYCMFDSTLPHNVTKNLSDDLRIVISMNFKFLDN
jgi:hypothetical protein